MEHLDLNSQSDCFPKSTRVSCSVEQVLVKAVDLVRSNHLDRPVVVVHLVVEEVSLRVVAVVVAPSPLFHIRCPWVSSPMVEVLPSALVISSLGADSGMGSGSHGRFFGRGASSVGTAALPSVKITRDEEELDDEVEDSFPSDSLLYGKITSLTGPPTASVIPLTIHGGGSAS
ncbi:hypothetical protein GUJ93_ZPchr0002g23967 [Zizania palustris]|uniref:Uncharacterized protein n=1 Tax=Zizania palustris TaxID=103762 RepID=A0A8J5S5M0_ZIZPA|nr:hypothetical protein GUJ93_ZPchr0002g23967 [Zizania palustris]